jgi:hypothetical protein
MGHAHDLTPGAFLHLDELIPEPGDLLLQAIGNPLRGLLDPVGGLERTAKACVLDLKLTDAPCIDLMRNLMRVLRPTCSALKCVLNPA